MMCAVIAPHRIGTVCRRRTRSRVGGRVFARLAFGRGSGVGVVRHIWYNRLVVFTRRRCTHGRVRQGAAMARSFASVSDRLSAEFKPRAVRQRTPHRVAGCHPCGCTRDGFESPRAGRGHVPESTSRVGRTGLRTSPARQAGERRLPKRTSNSRTEGRVSGGLWPRPRQQEHRRRAPQASSPASAKEKTCAFQSRRKVWAILARSSSIWRNLVPRECSASQRREARQPQPTSAQTGMQLQVYVGDLVGPAASTERTATRRRATRRATSLCSRNAS